MQFFLTIICKTKQTTQNRDYICLNIQAVIID